MSLSAPLPDPTSDKPVDKTSPPVVAGNADKNNLPEVDEAEVDALVSFYWASLMDDDMTIW